MLDSEKFCSIIEVIKSEKQTSKVKKTKFNLIGKALLITLITAIVSAYTLEPIIKEASISTRNIIATTLVIMTVLLIMHAIVSFLIFIWFFVKKAITSKASLVNRARAANDPLKNRARYAEVNFIKPAKALQKFYKRDLEKFCDWLDSRIKVEGFWAVFGAVLLTFAPKIGKSLNKLFDDLASQPDAFVSNPFPALAQFFYFDYLFILIALMILVTKIFIPRWMSYLHITRYALTHGYYRKT